MNPTTVIIGVFAIVVIIALLKVIGKLFKFILVLALLVFLALWLAMRFNGINF